MSQPLPTGGFKYLDVESELHILNEAYVKWNYIYEHKHEIEDKQKQYDLVMEKHIKASTYGSIE